jgi:hypothetical protein
VTKTTTYVLVGVVVVVGIYLVAAPQSPIKLGSSSGTTSSGAAAVIDASGRFIEAVGGAIGNLWGGDDDEEGP